MLRQSDDNSPETAVMYKSLYDTVWLIDTEDPILSGELAKAALELLFTGKFTNEDLLIAATLGNYKKLNQINQKKYANKVAKAEEAKIEKMQLNKIAELMQQNLNQTEIAQRLGIPRSTVSYRINLIRADYPELLKQQQEVERAAPASSPKIFKF